MEVPITQFRRELFSLVDQALNGAEVYVKHKGRRVRLVAEGAPSKLARLTPLQVLEPEDFDLENPAFKVQFLAEMQAEWEKDWAEI